MEKRDTIIEKKQKEKEPIKLIKVIQEKLVYQTYKEA